MDFINAFQCSGKMDIRRVDTSSTKGTDDKKEGEALTDSLVGKISEHQRRLFVNASRSVLVVLQGMDGAGKDSTIRRVFGRVNPAGCAVTSFKQPTPLEKQHDFLWRSHKAVPPRGSIGIFNRSYYEDTLIVRVHSDELLTPSERADKNIWDSRFDIINTFEDMLVKDNVIILKFFLHISKQEQRHRLQARQKDPAKQWKLDFADFRERKYWDDYVKAYNDCLSKTSIKSAPWYVIPADHKWYRNLAVAAIVEKTLSCLKLPPPSVTDKKLLKILI